MNVKRGLCLYKEESPGIREQVPQEAAPEHKLITFVRITVATPGIPACNGSYSTKFRRTDT